jgi:hypothetical protein
MVVVKMGCLRCRLHPLSHSEAVDLVVVNSVDCRMVADQTEGNSKGWMVNHCHWVVFAGTGRQAAY